MISVSTTRRARRGMVREWRLHALSVFSLAVAFVCLGAALLVVTNLQALEERWMRAGRASSGDARAEFGQRELSSKGELAALPVEAFPASIELDVAQDMPDAELADMVTKMKELPSVDDVETYQAWTERLGRLVRAGVTASAILAVVVFAAVLAVVGST